jgi:non-heme chloroperoxidase
VKIRERLFVSIRFRLRPLSAKLLKNGVLKTYKRFPHRMATTQAEVINPDLLAFLKA